MSENNQITGFIGKRLKELRVSKKYSVEQMAELLGVSVRAYRSYEKAERDPSTTSLAILAITLGVSANYLIGVTDNPELTPKKEDETVDISELKNNIIKSLELIKTERSLEELAIFIDYLIYKELEK